MGTFVKFILSFIVILPAVCYSGYGSMDNDYDEDHTSAGSSAIDEMGGAGAMEPSHDAENMSKVTSLEIPECTWDNKSGTNCIKDGKIPLEKCEYYCDQNKTFTINKRHNKIVSYSCSDSKINAGNNIMFIPKRMHDKLEKTTRGKTIAVQIPWVPFSKKQFLTVANMGKTEASVTVTKVRCSLKKHTRNKGNYRFYNN